MKDNYIYGIDKWSNTLFWETRDVELHGCCLRIRFEYGKYFMSSNNDNLLISVEKYMNKHRPKAHFSCYFETPEEAFSLLQQFAKDYNLKSTIL